MTLPRTITKEIRRLIAAGSNFTSDNYGSESADNGEYEILYDSYAAQKTLEAFAEFVITQKHRKATSKRDFKTS